MRLKIILSLAGIVLLIVSCFLAWLAFDSMGLKFRGVDEIKLTVNASKEINWGRPGFFNLFWTGIFLLFLFIRKRWSVWVVLAAAVFNMAWAIRNFVLLPACGGGNCPVREVGLYFLLAASVIMLLASFLSGRR